MIFNKTEILSLDRFYRANLINSIVGIKQASLIGTVSNKNILAFNCKKKTNVAAEILYVAANVLSSQSMYSLSNFYLNLAKYLIINTWSLDYGFSF